SGTVLSDIYSLGLLLYHCTGCAAPFVPKSEVMVEPARMSDWTPSEKRGGRDLEQVISRATRLRPSERYQTVNLFATDLKAVCENVRGHSGGATRKIAFAVLAASVGLALLAAGIAAYRRGSVKVLPVTTVPDGAVIQSIAVLPFQP